MNELEKSVVEAVAEVLSADTEWCVEEEDYALLLAAFRAGMRALPGSPLLEDVAASGRHRRILEDD